MTPFKKIHFVGIGGIGMSGLAKICLSSGIQVQGSNIGIEHPLLQALGQQGASLFNGHSTGRLEGVECVVLSSAIHPENPEVLEAQALGLPIKHRSQFMKELLTPYQTIAISGTHGKTTTTSLMGRVLDESQADPLIISGGIMEDYGSNVRLGKGPWAVVEADESDKSLINFFSLYGAIVTNIEEEHMENYGSLQALLDVFRQFLQTPSHFVVACGDDPYVRELVALLPAKGTLITYGTEPGCNVRATNILYHPTGMTFDAHFPNEVWEAIELSLLGTHNVLNSLAVITAGRYMGMGQDPIRAALKHFRGVRRRLTLTGTVQGVRYIDDYAHHPTEIHAVLRSLHRASRGRLIAVFQPHRFTRLRDCMNLFTQCFDYADQVILLPVYGAGETPIDGVDSLQLYTYFQRLGKSDNIILYPGGTACSEGVSDILGPLVQPGDTVVCLGAGNITDIAHRLPQAMQARSMG